MPATMKSANRIKHQAHKKWFNYPHDIYVLSLQQAKIETKRNDNNLMTKQIKKTDLKTS
jgi:hypothetical protein